MYKSLELLIVEDDESMGKVLERLAKENNWAYRLAKNGVDAIEILNREVFEVALVDIKLPGFSGMQLLEYLKANHFLTEVIMMTSVRKWFALRYSNSCIPLKPGNLISTKATSKTSRLRISMASTPFFAKR